MEVTREQLREHGLDLSFEHPKIGNASALLTISVVDGEKFDTKVEINDQIICCVAGMNEVIQKYRI